MIRWSSAQKLSIAAATPGLSAETASESNLNSQRGMRLVMSCRRTSSSCGHAQAASSTSTFETMFMSYLFVILFGLAVGSFLNVCIARLPRHESIVTPRSYCPRCERPIRWYDNIPLLSYLLLRGRCRDCGGRISPLYPAVEIITAGLLVAAWAQYGPGVEFIRSALLCTLLVVLIFTDLTVRKIPHAVTVFGTLAGLLLSLLAPVDDRPLEWLLQSFGVSLQGRTSSFLGAVCGAAFGAGLFLVGGQNIARLRHKEGLGFGDVTLMGMVGTFLGVPLTYATILSVLSWPASSQ